MFSWNLCPPCHGTPPNLSEDDWFAPASVGSTYDTPKPYQCSGSHSIGNQNHIKCRVTATFGPTMRFLSWTRFDHYHSYVWMYLECAFDMIILQTCSYDQVGVTHSQTDPLMALSFPVPSSWHLSATGPWYLANVHSALVFSPGSQLGQLHLTCQGT